MSTDQETAIQELEILSLLLGFKLFESSLRECRAVFFTDNEAVRGAFLKGWSANQSCSEVLFGLFSAEESLQSQVWLERVRSQSNPADVFPREVILTHQGLHRIRCDLAQTWRETVLHWGGSATKAT